jgi:two-component system alkaline phosphatase synthesis response regulator PhoP
MVAQLMPVHQSGLRLTGPHVRTGPPVPLPVEWAGTDPETHSFGEVTVNIPEMTVRRRGKVVTLALKEFRMLEHFLKNPGRVIARDELLNEVWGYQNYPCTRTVDNHMLRLRQKLEAEPSRPKHFLTIHSSGYKFVG